MAALHRLPFRDDDGNIRLVVECPRGSTVKLRYEPELGVFQLTRVLPHGITYPFDWGFVPGTLAEDGDPLDMMVLFRGGTWPGALVPARPIGVVRVSQTEADRRVENDRVLAVLPDEKKYRDLEDLPDVLRESLARFFVSVGKMAHDDVEVVGWGPASDAMGCIEKAARRASSRR